MHKTKEGKVMASLTEVKNQTGNIFTAADRYGEVYITSYNKVRYRIIKEETEDEMNIAPRSRRKVQLKDEPLPAAPVEFTPEPVREVVVDEIEPAIVKEPERATPVPIVPEPVVEEAAPTSENDTLIDVWDRNNALEKSFVREATKTLLP